MQHPLKNVIMKENLKKIHLSSFFGYFCATVDCWKGRFVSFRICNVPVFVVHDVNGLESINFQLISHICSDGLTKKSSTTAMCEKYENGVLMQHPLKNVIMKENLNKIHLSASLVSSVKLLIVEREDLYPLRICNVPLLVVHGVNG